MDWILNNLETVVVPIIIFILYGLGSASQKKAKQEQDARESEEYVEIEPGEARRVQQIQEEIRRKIAERTGRAVPPPPPKPAPVAQPSNHGRPQYSERDRSPPKPRVAAPPLYDQKAHQAEIEIKMRKVRELEAKIKSKPAEAEGWGFVKRRTPKGQLRKDLFKDLAHPLGQKKAILVAEILGPPVGSKGPACWKANV
jgi:type IV secretory pathway VirB10-like protein